MRIRGSLNERGLALTIVIIVIIMLVIISAFSANVGFNQKKLIDGASGRRAKIYYKAQAGVMNATWRIQNDYTVGLAPAGTFTTAAYNPGPYMLDVDTDGIIDVDVDIEPLQVNNGRLNRQILSTGRDVA